MGCTIINTLKHTLFAPSFSYTNTNCRAPLNIMQVELTFSSFVTFQLPTLSGNLTAGVGATVVGASVLVVVDLVVGFSVVVVVEVVVVVRAVVVVVSGSEGVVISVGEGASDFAVVWSSSVGKKSLNLGFLCMSSPKVVERTMKAQNSTISID